MADIDDLRDQVRARVQDTGVDAAELLSDNELDQLLQDAADQYSAIRPRELKASLTTDSSTPRLVDVSSLNPRHRIAGVVYPVEAVYPPNFVPFSVWGDQLTLDVGDEPTASDTVDVYWEGRHTPSTISAMDQYMIVEGAIAGACDLLAHQKRNTVNVSGDELWGKLSRMGADSRVAFRLMLRGISSVRRRRMYSTSQTARSQSQSTDPGPA